MNDPAVTRFTLGRSEIYDNEERFPMWRAFGGTPARVAIVWRVPWFTGAENELNVMFSPVAGLQETELHTQIAAVLQNVERERDFPRTVERPPLVAYVFNLLVAGVTCLEHEGFREQREWRAIYFPDGNRPIPVRVTKLLEKTKTERVQSS